MRGPPVRAHCVTVRRMPDPLSRAIALAVFPWTAGLPSPAQILISVVAQAGIAIPVALVIAAAWVEADPGSVVQRGWDAGWRLAPGFVAVVLALLLAKLLGHVLPEVRPFVALDQAPLFAHAPDASFPSDHVSGGMALLATRVRSGTVRALVVAITLIVGLARILSGVHWLDDIVGAAILGLLVARVVTSVWRRVMAESPGLPALR